MSENQVNVPLLRKAVEWVEYNALLPEIDREWNQEQWRSAPKERAAEMAYEATVEMWEKEHPDKAFKYWVDGYRTATGTQVVGYFRHAPEFNEMYRKVLNTMLPECKTAYCVAGYVCHVSFDKDVPVSKIEERARELLGLDHDQAWSLFNSDNDAVEVRKIAEMLAGEKL